MATLSTSPTQNAAGRTVATLPFDGRHAYYLTVSLMEQLIGSTLAAVTGVIVPMIVLLGHPHLTSLVQGLVAAMSLTGIAVGSMVMGSLSDRSGYLGYFRLCPVLIMAGSAMVWLWAGDSLALLMIGLFITGCGVGGGYSLDSDYISELMPAKWRFISLGIAKASSAVGFILGAVACYYIIHAERDASIWPALMIPVGVLGLITLLMRLRWWESPAWLMAHGMPKKALEAAGKFFGPGTGVIPAKKDDVKSATWRQMFERKNLPKVIFCGIPWACEGVGVYGIGVFLPMLVDALGLMPDSLHGILRIEHSVEITAWINFFILPGFIIGLLLMKRLWHVGMLTWGFVVCALGLVLLLVAHMTGLPIWVSLVGFFIFEIFLNAGPHLMTFVIPSEVYPVADRGAGVGIASMLGKIGAIVGVILMPVLLSAGGMELVLSVSIAVMVAGALISSILGRKVLPRS